MSVRGNFAKVGAPTGHPWLRRASCQSRRLNLMTAELRRVRHRLEVVANARSAILVDAAEAEVEDRVTCITLIVAAHVAAAAV